MTEEREGVCVCVSERDERFHTNKVQSWGTDSLPTPATVQRGCCVYTLGVKQMGRRNTANRRRRTSVPYSLCMGTVFWREILMLPRFSKHLEGWPWRRRSARQGNREYDNDIFVCLNAAGVKLDESNQKACRWKPQMSPRSLIKVRKSYVLVSYICTRSTAAPCRFTEAFSSSPHPGNIRCSAALRNSRPRSSKHERGSTEAVSSKRSGGRRTGCCRQPGKWL